MIAASFLKNKKRKQWILFQEAIIGFCDNSRVTKVSGALLNSVTCEYKLQDIMERCPFMSELNVEVWELSRKCYFPDQVF